MNFEEILEEGGRIWVRFDDRYPLEDLQKLADSLASTTYLVPGYIPAEAGFLSIETLLTSQMLGNFETRILPDRNIVTRMAKIAKRGADATQSLPDIVAANLMAMAQIVDWQIDPSIAFLELASRKGASAANDELSWFRQADRNQAQAWADIALGRSTELPFGQDFVLEEVEFPDEHPRWIRNYAACLKIAEIELSKLAPADKVSTLLRWMLQDFFLAGPAALFGIAYFSPRGRRKGMLKNLKSPDRAKAIAGVKNAAWDITYLSDFVRQVKASDFEERQFVLATADKALAEVAGVLFCGGDSKDPRDEFAAAFEKWWPKRDAASIAHELVDSIETAMNRPPPGSPDVDPFPDIIGAGESYVLNWKGRS